LAPDLAPVLLREVKQCKHFIMGGHLCPGSLMRTTAELVLGLLPEWRFSRELDPATGYAELRISPRSLG
jgi:uncharacterized protein